MTRAKPHTPRSPAPLPGPVRHDADGGTRERILAAAAAEFAAIGYAGARVDEIAAKAGVNKAMLYYHVGGKRELYVAVLTGTLDRALASLRAAVEGLGSPAERLQAVIDTLAHIGAENPVFVPIVMREVASGGDNLPDEMVVRMSAVFRFVSGIIEDGIRAGVFRRVDSLRTHVTLVGSTMFCIASHRLQQRVARIAGLSPRPVDPAALAAHIGTLFLHGLELHRPRSGRAGAAPRRRK
jgi:AcrR family transcriptional regulator